MWKSDRVVPHALAKETPQRRQQRRPIHAIRIGFVQVPPLAAGVVRGRPNRGTGRRTQRHLPVAQRRAEQLVGRDEVAQRKRRRRLCGPLQTSMTRTGGTPPLAR
jgi:hypothetical protein